MSELLLIRKVTQCYLLPVQHHPPQTGGKEITDVDINVYSFTVLNTQHPNLFCPQGYYIYSHGGRCEKGEEGVKWPIRGEGEHGMMGKHTSSGMCLDFMAGYDIAGIFQP